ncbi:MAG: hypothetical protein HY243_01640 [Proteobacteria bacterium]|nr:hypothetical protein [Pseudomonadota bacterium]
MKRSAISLLCAAMMVAAPMSALAASQTSSTSSTKPLPAGPSAGVQRAGRNAGPIHHVPVFRQGSGTVMGTITTTTTTTTTTTVP